MNEEPAVRRMFEGKSKTSHSNRAGTHSSESLRGAFWTTKQSRVLKMIPAKNSNRSPGCCELPGRDAEAFGSIMAAPLKGAFASFHLLASGGQNRPQFPVIVYKKRRTPINAAPGPIPPSPVLSSKTRRPDQFPASTGINFDSFARIKNNRLPQFTF